jgi:chromosomal replication initiation ATPase DnaA
VEKNVEKQGMESDWHAHMTGSIWDQVLSRVETKVNRHIFYTWFKPTAFVRDDGGSLKVRVPNALFSDWLTKHYAGVLEEALSEVNRKGTTVTFVTETRQTAEPVPPVPDRLNRRTITRLEAWPHATPSTRSSWAPPTSSRTPPAAR